MTTIAVWILAGLGGFTLVTGVGGIALLFMQGDDKAARNMFGGILFLLFSALMFWLAGSV